MKCTRFFICALLLLPCCVQAQQYFTKNGTITFFSKTPLENISATNSQVLSVLNTQTGAFNFSLQIVNFHFKKALMEEHFNENYLESGKYPKAVFKGIIADMGKLNLAADGTYPVSVTGDLEIHGVTRKVTVPGTLKVQGGKLEANASFSVRPADHKIAIPGLMKDNIAERIDVSVSCRYEPKQ